MSWWQQINLADTSITCLPFVHFSGRGLFDRNKTLWLALQSRMKVKNMVLMTILLMVKYSKKLVKNNKLLT